MNRSGPTHYDGDYARSMSGKAICELDNTRHLVWLIILDASSPVIFTAQTGGIACCHPGVSGIAVPIASQLTDFGKPIHDIMCAGCSPGRGHKPCHRRSSFDADNVSDAKEGTPAPDLEQSDRDAIQTELDRLAIGVVLDEPAALRDEMMEAWIPVLWHGRKAIVLYENCD